MQQTPSIINLIDPIANGKRPSANIINVSTQQDAQTQAFADAATSGARVFLCHVYQQGGRSHLVFSLPMNILVELAKLQSAETKKNKSDVEEKMNRPKIPSHVNDIAKYLLYTDKYILPPFIFNCNTPLKVFSYGTGPVQSGYAIISSNIELYVTDGQHRLEAIKKVLPERPELKNDSVTVLVVQEEDIDQIHQDFADCAKNQPIPKALRAAFDVSDTLSKLARQISQDLVIFTGRIDKISGSVGKAPDYMFTMNQLRVGVAEFLFGSSRKQLFESHVNVNRAEYEKMLTNTKYFYTEFAKHNEVWTLLFQPASQTTGLNLYEIRQKRIDFNSVGFQIISRIGHLIFNQTPVLSDVQHETLIKTLANLDYSRECQLWQNSVVTDKEDKQGNITKTIVNHQTTVNKGYKIAVRELENRTGITLI
ncbi:DGQHR domain protein [Rippkaea orientalis PCC 8801]|uniref:DGQHR domain protein n=1 Tax=Rippkaea orientalis (strain PCC 8801 / RF-1) TaxID=41431 RepID=B7K2M2_RIPO1|nr:DNA sulfur modification protein DndB [Rippkaea orientalis]ACK66415.1 DGQHR domain protein [Rippkaea orientalis PCC 8801]